MCLQSAVGGLTLVLAGLLVPIEVTGTRLAEGGTKLTIDFLVVGAAPKPLSMSVAMDATLPLEARDANLLLALAPALAVFLREHGTHDMAAPLGKAARAPVVPEPMLCAARSVSKKDACIGDVLVRARRAMQQAGHRVPNLGFLKLGGCTLEAWLDLHANYMERAAMVEERLAETARAMKRKIEEVDADMKAMVDCLHQTRRHFMLCVAHGLRSLP